MLENDQKRPPQTVNLPHQKPTENKENILPHTIFNQLLLSQGKQDNMATIIMRRQWKWVGHVIRTEQDNITLTALHWTPDGKRKKGRPKNTWHRTVEGEMKTLHHTWGSIKTLAQNRQEWISFVAAPHASSKCSISVCTVYLRGLRARLHLCV